MNLLGQLAQNPTCHDILHDNGDTIGLRGVAWLCFSTQITKTIFPSFHPGRVAEAHAWLFARTTWIPTGPKISINWVSNPPRHAEVHAMIIVRLFCKS